MKKRKDYDRITISARDSVNFMTDVVRWIQSNLSPDDVFTDAQLIKWAEENYERQQA